MPIVPQSQPIVNNSVESFDSDDKIMKWTKKKAASRRMAARLFKAGLETRAARMYECGDYIMQRINPATGEIMTDTTQLCRDRLCPTCSWRLSLRRFSEMMAVFSALSEEITSNGYKVSMLTLTVRNMALSELRPAIDAFSKAWHNMSRRDLFSDVIGWTRSLEITYNKKSDTYHPHYHCILIWRNESFTEAAAEIMREAWKHAYKCDYNPIIDIRDVYCRDESSPEKGSIVRAALEAFKYSVKEDSVKYIPDKDLFNFAAAIKNVRFVSYGKAIKEMRKALGFKNDDLAQPENITNNCPDSLIIAVMRWNGTAYTKTALEAEPWRLSRERLRREIELAAADESEVQ